MNVFDSNIANKKQADLAVSVPVNKISEKNKITYSAQLENRIYNATVWINSQSKIQAELTAMDQNKRELWREKGAGEVTLKLRVSE
ncbi:hypothetical protein DSM107007_57210 [Nostoc sp. PCC 7120 = FACHB-418]|nr:hypothetical protein DSM107007_57210 [Nostoc sp. PCC 7120 = FACHB-418]